MKLAVITAIFGGYDNIPPIPKGFDEAILVSDVPIKSEWSNIVISTSLQPRLASKIPKFRPDLFTDLDASVWVDASMRDPSDWLSTKCRQLLIDNSFILFRHPERDSVADEIRASKIIAKYDGQPFDKQMQNYESMGFADDVGLWACGVIARNHTPENEAFGDSWFLHNALWSIQDQLSFPYLVWRNKLKVKSFEEHQYSGPLSWFPHSHELLSGGTTQVSSLRLFTTTIRYFKLLIFLIKRGQFKEIISGVKNLVNSFFRR